MATNWIEYDPLSLKYSGVRNDPCVYCVQIDGITVYVGYGKNIHLPWCSIADTQKLTVKVGFTKRYGDWVMRELRLIRKLKPDFNIAHKSPRIQK